MVWDRQAAQVDLVTWQGERIPWIAVTPTRLGKQVRRVERGMFPLHSQRPSALAFDFHYIPQGGDFDLSVPSLFLLDPLTGSTTMMPNEALCRDYIVADSHSALGERYLACRCHDAARRCLRWAFIDLRQPRQQIEAELPVRMDFPL